MKLFLTAILFLGFTAQALACDCMRSSPERDKEILETAYIIVRGKVKNVVPLKQSYGVIMTHDDSRVELELIESYTAPLGDNKDYAVEYDFGGCSWDLPKIGEVRDLIIFEKEQGRLVIGTTCDNLTSEAWESLKENPEQKF